MMKNTILIFAFLVLTLSSFAQNGGRHTLESETNTKQNQIKKWEAGTYKEGSVVYHGTSKTRTYISTQETSLEPSPSSNPWEIVIPNKDIAVDKAVQVGDLVRTNTGPGTPPLIIMKVHTAATSENPIDFAWLSNYAGIYAVNLDSTTMEWNVSTIYDSNSPGFPYSYLVKVNNVLYRTEVKSVGDNPTATYPWIELNSDYTSLDALDNELKNYISKDKIDTVKATATKVFLGDLKVPNHYKSDGTLDNTRSVNSAASYKTVVDYVDREGMFVHPIINGQPDKSAGITHKLYKNYFTTSENTLAYGSVYLGGGTPGINPSMILGTSNVSAGTGNRFKGVLNYSFGTGNTGLEFIAGGSNYYANNLQVIGSENKNIPQSSTVIGSTNKWYETGPTPTSGLAHVVFGRENKFIFPSNFTVANGGVVLGLNNTTRVAGALTIGMNNVQNKESAFIAGVTNESTDGGSSSYFVSMFGRNLKSIQPSDNLQVGIQTVIGSKNADMHYFPQVTNPRFVLGTGNLQDAVGFNYLVVDKDQNGWLGSKLIYNPNQTILITEPTQLVTKKFVEDFQPRIYSMTNPLAFTMNDIYPNNWYTLSIDKPANGEIKIVIKIKNTGAITTSYSTTALYDNSVINDSGEQSTPNLGEYVITTKAGTHGKEEMMIMNRANVQSTYWNSYRVIVNKLGNTRGGYNSFSRKNKRI